MVNSRTFFDVFAAGRITIRLAVLVSVLLTLTARLVAQGGVNVDIKADSFVPKTIVAENATQLIFHNTLKSKVNVRCNGTESVKFDIEEGKNENKTLKAGEYKCEIMVADKTVNAGTISITCAPAKDGKKVAAKVAFKDIDTSADGFRLGDWFEFTNISDQPLSIKSVEGLFDTGELAPGQVSSIRPTRAGRNDLIVYRGTSTGARLRVIVQCP